MNGAQFDARHKTTAGRFRALSGAAPAIGASGMISKDDILNALIIDGEDNGGQSLVNNECGIALNGPISRLETP
jgi:hypothetical protein